MESLCHWGSLAGQLRLAIRDLVVDPGGRTDVALIRSGEQVAARADACEPCGVKSRNVLEIIALKPSGHGEIATFRFPIETRQGGPGYEMVVMVTL